MNTLLTVFLGALVLALVLIALAQWLSVRRHTRRKGSFVMLLLIEGFVSLGFQVLAIRKLLPVTGSSVIETGVVIAVFLLALAVGYHIGGRPVPAPLVKLARNFALAALASVLMLSPVIAALFAHLGYRPGLVVYAVVVVAPVAYFMGQSIPLVIQARRAERTASEQAGNALFASTVGSFAGAIAVSVVLFMTIGVMATHAVLVGLCLFGAITALAATGDSRWHRPGRVAYPLGLVLALTLVAHQALWQQHHREHVVHAYDNAYSDTRIEATPTQRRWVTNGLVMSYLQGGRGAPYIEKMKTHIQAIAGELDRAPQVLVLGAAGFSLSFNANVEASYTYVDIDPEVKAAAEAHFLRRDIDHEFHAMDARGFLRRQPRRWDVIVLDTYSAGMNVPEHLLTREFFSLVEQRLRHQGRVLMNMVARADFRDAYSRSVHHTITSVFSLCRQNFDPTVSGMQNILYHCHRDPGRPALYTDDRNRSQYDFQNAGWRARSLLEP